MSTTIVESTTINIPAIQDSNVITLPIAPVEIAQPRKAGWVAKQVQKAYISSFNLCLSELGWVPTKVLEIGSGDGTLLAHLAQQFTSLEQVVGIEPDKDKLSIARERSCCSMEFVHINEGEAIPYPDNHFDLVISHGFLGETLLPRFWMAEMTRVSAEALIISVPSKTGVQLGSWVPGAKDITLCGKPFVSDKTAPVPAERIRTWLDRHKLDAKLNLSPMPYNMVLARKQQPAA